MDPIEVFLNSIACENAHKVVEGNVWGSIEEYLNSLRSDQSQVNAEIVSNPQLDQKETAIQRETQSNGVADQTNLNGKFSHKTAEQSQGKEVGKHLVSGDQHHSVYQAGKNSVQKGFASMSNSVKTEISTKPIRGKRRRNDSTPTATVHDTTVAIQQANLPTSTTPLQAHSARKQLESSKDVDKAEKKIDSVALSNDSAEVDNSNSSARHKSPLPETPTDSDDVDMLISSMSDRFTTASPTQILVDLIPLMEIQLENTRVLKRCRRLIDQYSVAQLRNLTSPMRGRLIYTLLSAVKRHCHNSFVVERFCDLLREKIGVDQDEFDWYLDQIDFLLEISCDENKLSSMAKKSSLKLLKEIKSISSGLVGMLFFSGNNVVEKIYQLIRRQQLYLSEYDEVMQISWDFMRRICCDSVSSRKRFLDIGGLKLFKLTYEKFNDQPKLVATMANLMGILSEEKSNRHGMMADGNLEILWQIWSEAKDVRLSYFCRRIFTDFLSYPQADWPVGNPTKEEIKMKLEEVKIVQKLT